MGTLETSTGHSGAWSACRYLAALRSPVGRAHCARRASAVRALPLTAWISARWGETWPAAAPESLSPLLPLLLLPLLLLLLLHLLLLLLLHLHPALLVPTLAPSRVAGGSDQQAGGGFSSSSGVKVPPSPPSSTLGPTLKPLKKSNQSLPPPSPPPPRPSPCTPDGQSVVL